MNPHVCVDCGHESFNHTNSHPLYGKDINVCLVRGYGFLGMRRCDCYGFRPDRSES